MHIICIHCFTRPAFPIFQYPGHNEAGLRFLRETTAKYPKASGVWVGALFPIIATRHPDTTKEIFKSTGITMITDYCVDMLEVVTCRNYVNVHVNMYIIYMHVSVDTFNIYIILIMLLIP